MYLSPTSVHLCDLAVTLAKGSLSICDRRPAVVELVGVTLMALTLSVSADGVDLARASGVSHGPLGQPLGLTIVVGAEPYANECGLVFRPVDTMNRLRHPPVYLEHEIRGFEPTSDLRVGLSLGHHQVGAAQEVAELLRQMGRM